MIKTPGILCTALLAAVLTSAAAEAQTCYVTITASSCTEQLSNTTHDLPDTDCDGVSDEGFFCRGGGWFAYPDNCPEVPNTDQTDSDHDGSGDACDVCPNDHRDDEDGDGFCYTLDNCPAVYNPQQTDSDNDTLGDICDNCPFTPNPGQYDLDNDGVGSDCDNCLFVPNPGQADRDNDTVGDYCDPDAVLYVDSESTCTEDCGLSWETAFQTIQEGVTASGSQVWVKQGTYVLSTEIMIDRSRFGVYGGFSGTEDTREERDWNSFPTIVDGQNATRCFTLSGMYNTFDGFVIRNGYTDEDGGGMRMPFTNSDVANCIFINNHAAKGGAIAIPSGASHTISGCFFLNNSAVEDGGAVSCGVGDPHFKNCVFSGNTADLGGAVSFVRPYSPNLTNCTLAFNDSNLGGGLYSFQFSQDGHVYVKNTIMYGNTAAGDADRQIYEVYDPTVNVSYSDIEGGYAGTENLDVDPLFADPLGPDGIPGTLDDNYRLQAGSPCIDTGDAAGASSYVKTDIEGTARPQGADYDIGAYEYVPPTLVRLVSFHARTKNKKVTVIWSTASEIDNAGFNIHRSSTKKGSYFRINDDLIPAEGSAAEGASYEFIDEDTRKRGACWYKLEDIDLNGVSTMHGPVRATPLLPHSSKR